MTAPERLDHFMAPERLDHYMARANAIYYASRDPFADFTTAPEISQIFGEILGLWAAVVWQSIGAPSAVALVEAGPGRGTLMADALRAIRRAIPAFADALAVHFIETSPRLRAAQAVRVPEATWHLGLDTVPDDRPMILLANEFLDALPIRQFVRRGTSWTERYVANGQWLEQPADPALVPSGRTALEGDVVELNEPARAFIATVSARLRNQLGAALFLDYGPAHSTAGDSLQALASKQPVDPLSLAGAADLTAHVDFADLAAVTRAAGAAVHGPHPQGAFLTALGLLQRTERLAGSQPERAEMLMTAARRLADPREMGTLFKAFAVTAPNCPPPPGFAPAA